MWFSPMTHDALTVGAYALREATDVYEFRLPSDTSTSSPEREHPCGVASGQWCGSILTGLLRLAPGERVLLGRSIVYAEPSSLVPQAVWTPVPTEQREQLIDVDEFVELDRAQLVEATNALDPHETFMRLPEVIYFSNGLLFRLPMYAGAGYLSATYDIEAHLNHFDGTPWSKVLPTQRAFTECYYW